MDPDFIDLDDIPFEPDAALLLCSDGLTDLVDSATILNIVGRLAGRPHDVVRELIQAANDAGGRDNITAVYVEGDQVARQGRGFEEWTVNEARTDRPPIAGYSEPGPALSHTPALVGGGRARRGRLRRIVPAGLVVLLALGLGAWFFRDDLLQWLARLQGMAPARTGLIVVTPSGSIAAAMAEAAPGGTVMVEPGEYRERLVLTNGVRLVSRVPRGATIRLPGTASEGDPAVVADGISGAEMAGFRIVGDAATPLGTGIFVRDAEVSVVDVEITGASHAAIAVIDAARLRLLASHIHDNPGAALTIHRGAAPAFSHNVFSRNGLSERTGAALIVEPETQPTFFGNVFHGVAPDAFRALGDAAAAAVVRDNWFVDGRESAARSSSAARSGRGR
jgi:hypothetical protein